MIPRSLPALVLVAALPLLAAPAHAKKTKEQKLAAAIQKKVADGRYVGYRGDGESIDDVYCANGKYASNTGGAISTGKQWKVVHPTGNKKNFAAILKDGSYAISIALHNGQWQIGYEYFDEPEALGDVERTDAKADCKSL